MCYNAPYREGEMLISQRRDIITLIPEKDSNLLQLTNWRPITLLNLDYKVYQLMTKLCFGILRITLKRHRLLPDDKGEKTTKETTR